MGMTQNHQAITRQWDATRATATTSSVSQP